MIRKIMLVAVLASALAVSGCGGAQQQQQSPQAPAAPSSGGTPPATTAPDPPKPSVASVELTVKLTEYSFEPKELIIPQGAEVKLTVINEGKRSHNFAVAAFGIESNILDAGQQQVLTFKADKAGRYDIACTQKGHKDKGMVGILTVQ